MIKTLSPHYVYVPFVSPLTGAISTSYKLDIRVWEGLKENVPTLPVYSKTIVNVEQTTGVDKLNISRLINDFLELKPQINLSTDVISGVNQVWVQTSVIYKTSNPLDDGVSQNVVKDLAVKGYAYGDDGENTTTPSNKILLTGKEFNVSRSGIFIIPIETDALEVSVKSFPNNEIFFIKTLTTTTNSKDFIKYIYVYLSDTTLDTGVNVSYNGNSIYLNILDECKYIPIDVVFFNKNGAQQSITLFKERTDSLKIKDEYFEGKIGQPIDGFHQFSRYNIQARSSFKINSGFVDETMNDVFTELLLSTKIWSYSGNKLLPLNIKTTSFSYKTRQKDRLINYEIEFEYSFYKINNI